MTHQHTDADRDSALAEQAELIAALRDPARYPHPVSNLQVLETHISWVILTGSFAYKIKKAVDFGFLDFSTLQKRRFYCEEELRLNRRFAPDLYLQVMPLTGSRQQPQWCGSGQPLEYAVRMRQFPQAGLLSEVAARQALSTAHIDELALLVAAMHVQVAVAGADSSYGLPHDVRHWVMENFSHIRPLLVSAEQQQELRQLEDWCRQEFGHEHTLLDERRRDGFVRECHGDLHLGNLALIEGRITPFDGIEFNPQLAWIDVMSEVAFLFMDLQDRGYAGFAWRFLNGYLQQSGDYAGVRLLPYYLVYRALVRAKVAVLRLGQAGLDAGAGQAAREEYNTYLQLARQYTQDRRPAMIITNGVSGSGKSWYAARLAEQFGAIRVRSDVERKRLFGFAADADTGSGIQSGIYSTSASDKTYTELARLSQHILAAGYPVIVDAAFLKRAERERFRQLAADLQVAFVMLSCSAPESVLRQRLQARQAASNDPSEAGIAVLDAQLESQELPGVDERDEQISIGPGDDLSADTLAERVRIQINAPAS
ncbi:MAG: AAA family ATPase [Pseudomonadota bacterium]